MRGKKLWSTKLSLNLCLVLVLVLSLTIPEVETKYNSFFCHQHHHIQHYFETTTILTTMMIILLPKSICPHRGPLARRGSEAGWGVGAKLARSKKRGRTEDRGQQAGQACGQHSTVHGQHETLTWPLSSSLPFPQPRHSGGGIKVSYYNHHIQHIFQTTNLTTMINILRSICPHCVAVARQGIGAGRGVQAKVARSKKRGRTSKRGWSRNSK